MEPFKPSVHRKVFIDRQIRGENYPTAVSLAAAYRQEFGKPVDPRTIAADIASLRQDYGAPIAYDYERRGYYYKNPTFKLIILPHEQERSVPLRHIIPEDFPKTAFLPAWQHELLASLVNKVFPVAGDRNPLAGKISVLPARKPQTASHALLWTALAECRFTRVRHRMEEFDFLPLHLILSADGQLAAGRVRSGGGERDALLAIDALTELELKEHAAPPAFIYAQTTNNNDIELIISGDNSDVLLVFSHSRATMRPQSPSEWTLLAKTEIFAAVI